MFISACTCINLGWRHRSRTCWEKLHSQVLPSYKSYFILQYNRLAVWLSHSKSPRWSHELAEAAVHRNSSIQEIFKVITMVSSITTQPVCFYFIQRKRLVTWGASWISTAFRCQLSVRLEESWPMSCQWTKLPVSLRTFSYFLFVTEARRPEWQWPGVFVFSARCCDCH